MTIATAVTAMLLFAAATQGYFIARCKAWEIVALLLIAFTLFRPGYWLDQVYEPLVSVPATQIYDIAGELPENGQIRLRVIGETLEGAPVDRVVMLNLGEVGEGPDRINQAGLELREDDGKMIIDNVAFGSFAEKQQLDFDWEIKSVQQENKERPAKQWLYIPALLLLGVVVMLQRRRRDSAELAAA